MNKGKLSQLRTGYSNVHGKNDLKDAEIIRIANDIIFNTEEYPFEKGTDIMRERMTSISELSDSDAINEWLAKVPEGIIDSNHRTIYTRLFALGTAYSSNQNSQNVKPNPKEIEEVKELEEYSKEVSSNDTEVDAMNPDTPIMEEEPKGAETKSDVDGIEDDSKVDTINNTKSKEETKMTTELNPIDKLQQEVTGMEGVGDNVASNVTQVSKNDKKAAVALINETQTSRMAYSKEAKVKHVLITQIDRAKKAVQGRDSMGTVSNPQKAFETFVAKTGASVEDGVVTFSKLHPTETHDNAMKLYNAIVEAKENPDYKLKPYFGKENAPVATSIKGIELVDPKGKNLVLPQKDIAPHILNNAFLYLDVDSKTKAQFQLDAAVARGGKEPKKSYVVRIANKAALIEDDTVVIYVRSIGDKKAETMTGYKSELTVACVSDQLDNKARPKKTSWRIPLEVEQYEIVTMAEYEDLFKGGLGNTVKPISAESQEEITSIIGTISTLLATEANKVDSVLGADLTAKMNEERSKLAAAEADKVNEILSPADESEFEA